MFLKNFQKQVFETLFAKQSVCSVSAMSFENKNFICETKCL